MAQTHCPQSTRLVRLATRTDVNAVKIANIKVIMNKQYLRYPPELVSGHFLLCAGLGQLRSERSHPRRDLLLGQPAQPHQRYTHRDSLSAKQYTAEPSSPEPLRLNKNNAMKFIITAQ